MNAARIITAAERIMTVAKRAIVSDDRDARRDEIMVEFGQLATDLGKIATRISPTNWGGIVMASYDLHTAGCNALERQCGTFAHVGSEAALLTSLHAFAAVMGFTLADAAVALEEDDALREIVVGSDYRFIGESSDFYTRGKLYRARGRDNGGMFRFDDDYAGDRAQHWWMANANFWAHFEAVSDDAARVAVEGMSAPEIIPALGEVYQEAAE